MQVERREVPPACWVVRRDRTPELARGPGPRVERGPGIPQELPRPVVGLEIGRTRPALRSPVGANGDAPVRRTAESLRRAGGTRVDPARLEDGRCLHPHAVGHRRLAVGHRASRRGGHERFAPRLRLGRQARRKRRGGAYELRGRREHRSHPLGGTRRRRHGREHAPSVAYVGLTRTNSTLGAGRWRPLAPTGPASGRTRGPRPRPPRPRGEPPRTRPACPPS